MQLAAGELGLALDRDLSVTGGLTFAAYPAKSDLPGQLRLSCGVDDGARAWAICRAPEVLANVGREELCGRAVHINNDGIATLS